MTLGDLVKNYREKNNISMDEFSKMCNLSKGYISMLENNTNPRNNKPIAPTLPTIKKISLALNSDVDSVLKALDSDQEINLNCKMGKNIGIGNKRKRLQEEKDLTPPELAELLDVTVGSVSNYENDITPSEYKHLKNFRRLDSKGKEHVLTVLEWETDRVSVLNSPKEQSPNLCDKEYHNEKTEQPTRTLHYYQRLASAGTGQIVFEDVPVDLIEIPDIPEYERVKYAIGVNGDSMEPLYYDGDILLVEPMQDVRVNEIGIFIVDGESLVKKRGKNSLISLNKKKNYPEIPVNEETRCLGQVVDKITSLDNIYAALNEDDLSVEQGSELPQMQDIEFDEKMNEMDIDESSSNGKVTHTLPDMSAFAPEDLKALENGKIQMFRAGKKA